MYIIFAVVLDRLRSLYIVSFNNFFFEVQIPSVDIPRTMVTHEKHQYVLNCYVNYHLQIFWAYCIPRYVISANSSAAFHPYGQLKNKWVQYSCHYYGKNIESSKVLHILTTG